MSDSEFKADCYSESERSTMVWYQQLREWLLSPLLELLTRCGIRADHLTFLSFIVGLAFCPLFFWSPFWAFVMLLLHAVIDGFDGPLARHNGEASARGSFTDTMADQLVVTACTITWMAHPQQLIGVTSGSLYVFLYTVVVVFAMVRNALGAAYPFLVRPRFVVYIWMAMEAFLFSGTSLEGSLEYVLWACNAFLALMMLTGFVRIRQRLGEQK